MGGGLRERIEATVRPRVPTAALPALVDLRTRRARSSATAWSEGQRQMRFLLQARSPETDFDDLTARYLHVMRWRGEIRFHPELITRQRVDGAEHLREARDRGVGVIVSFMHHGFYDGLFGSLAAAGLPCAPVATPSMFKPTMPLWMRQQLAVVRLGGPPLNADDGRRGISEALAGGRVIGIATDVPSTTPMDFMGRRLLGSFGAARLAFEDGIPVVMATAHPEPGGRFPSASIRLAPPVDPAAFASARDLLEHLVAHQEVAIAAWPEASDQPLKRWGIDPGQEVDWEPGPDLSWRS